MKQIIIDLEPLLKKRGLNFTQLAARIGRHQSVVARFQYTTLMPLGLLAAICENLEVQPGDIIKLVDVAPEPTPTKATNQRTG